MRPRFDTLALLTGLALVGPNPTAQDSAQGFPPPLDEPFVLPLGEIADQVARVTALDPHEPAPLPRWPAWSDRSETGWGGERPWQEWVELVRAEARFGASNTSDDPEHALRRARLALLAVDQGRGADAWRHVRAIGDDLLVLSILPALLPGVPLDRLGSTEPLPADVLLRPMVPPPALEVRGDIDPVAPLIGRIMEHRELRVADSLLSLRVLVESDGVQIDVQHRAGPTVGVRVLPPLPTGVRVGLLYSDWAKVGKERAVVPLQITDDSERHTIWARFLPERERWPSAPEPSHPGRPADIVVVVPRARLDEPMPRRFTAALAQLFGKTARLRAADERDLASSFEPIAIHLGSPGDSDEGSDERLIGLFAMIEAQALAGAALH